MSKVVLPFRCLSIFDLALCSNCIAYSIAIMIIIIVIIIYLFTVGLSYSSRLINASHFDEIVATKKMK